MYVAIDGSFILQMPIFEVKKDGDYLHRDIFDCDSLIAPTVALLNMKGYPTKYSCQGHMSTHYALNPYDDGVNKVSIINCTNIYTPYIMFDHHKCSIRNFIPFGVPKGWYVEFFTKKNKSIIIEDFEKDKIIKGCDYCFRLDEVPYFEKVEKYGKDYTAFDFYEDMLKEHRRFYDWVNSITQRPKKYRINRTIVLDENNT